jgi:hypothetical protein
MAAFVTFAGVQDYLTVTAAADFADQQRQRFEAGEPLVPVDSAMRPAVARSVRIAGLTAGLVVLAGIGGSVVLRRLLQPSA